MNLIEQIVNDFSELSDLLQTIELLSLLSCFDLYKLDLVKKNACIKQLFKYIRLEILEKSEKNTKDITHSLMINNLDYFNLFTGILHICFNLCLDKKQEMVDHYKRNYEISDEDFHSFEEMQMKYNNDAYKEGVEFMQYNQKIMKDFGVKTLISKDLKISKFLSYFIENYHKNFSFNIQVNFIHIF